MSERRETHTPHLPSLFSHEFAAFGEHLGHLSAVSHGVASDER